MTINRKVHCTNPDCPHEALKFLSDYIREKCPDSATGYSVSDIDFMVWNWKTKRFMLIEVKTRNTPVKEGQRKMYDNLHKFLQVGVNNGWSYLGFHLITFEHNSFLDGKVFLNHKEISEENLRIFLSMTDSMPVSYNPNTTTKTY